MIKTLKVKQVSHKASKLIYPEIDFNIKPSGTYKKKDFFNVLSKIAFEQEFTNTGAKLYQLEKDKNYRVELIDNVRINC